MRAAHAEHVSKLEAEHKAIETENAASYESVVTVIRKEHAEALALKEEQMDALHEAAALENSFRRRRLEDSPSRRCRKILSGTSPQCWTIA